MSDGLCSKCKNEPAEPRQRWGRHCFNAYKRTRTAARLLRERAAEVLEVEEPATEEVDTQPVETLENQAEPAAAVGEKAQPAGNVPSATRSNRGNAAGNARNAPPSRAAIAPEWIYEAPERFVPFRDTPDHGPEWAGPFLADYSVHGGQPLAAARAGVTMKTVERQAKTDPIFAEETRRALEYHHALLEWESLNLGRCKHSPLPYFDRLKAELPARHLERSMVMNVDASPAPPFDAAALLRAMLGQSTDATRALLAQGPTVIDVTPALPEADPPR